jgi:hypothetical protein
MTELLALVKKSMRTVGKPFILLNQLVDFLIGFNPSGRGEKMNDWQKRADEMKDSLQQLGDWIPQV